MTMRLLHFSDLHVQLRDWRTRPFRDLGPLRSVATAELWLRRGTKFDGAEERTRKLVALGRGFDHVLCTGDLVQLCHPDEFALARAALEPLASDPARFTCIAGNHDRYPWDFATPRFFERHFPEQLKSDLPPEFTRTRLLDGVALVLFDSADPMSWPILTKGKALGPALDALERTMAHAEVRSRAALVAIHHSPLRPQGFAGVPVHALWGYSRFLKIAKEGGALAVLAGHVHERYELAETRDRPRILCVGSSTELGKEGAYAI
ncbi:MAG: metallophosphoesterase, partial [Deltaproteobacteria bacterium]|nr:metallophosphoesterase [Deltaproteobacteria bacterium]